MYTPSRIPLVGLIQSLCYEWIRCECHSVHRNRKREHIDLEDVRDKLSVLTYDRVHVAPLPQEHLWRDEAWRAAAPRDIIVLDTGREPEVCEDHFQGTIL